MREALLKLLELQEIDLEIDQRQKALAALDRGEAAKLEIEGISAELARAAQERKQTEKEYVDRDLALKGLEQKKKKAEELMYSGKVRNLKELDDLQKEVAMFTREIDNLSTQVLELMDELEVRRQAEKEAQAALARNQQHLQEVLARYESESARLQGELAERQTRRQASAALVPQLVLRRYEQIQAKQGVLAAVAMKDEVCYGCHVAASSHLMTALRASQSLQTCDSCGRLLIWLGDGEDEAEEEAE